MSLYHTRSIPSQSSHNCGYKGMFPNRAQVVTMFPRSQLLWNQNGNIAPEPFLNMLYPPNLPGTLLVPKPIDSNRRQLISGDSRIMFIFVHFIHSMNQGNISQEAYNVSTHATVSYQSKSNWVHGYIQPKICFQIGHKCFHDLGFIFCTLNYNVSNVFKEIVGITQ